MKSLVFKVDNGLVSISNLVQETDLMVNLLEWFNHHNEMSDTALHLLLLLAQVRMMAFQAALL